MICIFHKHNDVFTDCPTCMRQDRARAAVTRAEAAATIAQIKLEERNEKRQQELNQREAEKNQRRQAFHTERQRDFLNSCRERLNILNTYAKKRQLTAIAIVDDYAKMKFMFENSDFVKKLNLDDRVLFFGNNIENNEYTYEGTKFSITSVLEKYPHEISLKWKLTRSILDTSASMNVFKSNFKFEDAELSIIFNPEILAELREKTNPIPEVEFRTHCIVYLQDENEIKLLQNELQELPERFKDFQDFTLNEEYKKSKKMPTYIKLWSLNLIGIFGWHNIYIGRWFRWMVQCILTMMLFGSLEGKADDHPWIIYFIGLLWACFETTTSKDSDGKELMLDPNEKNKK